MARNWTMADAIKAIAEQNMEDVKDIYRRFPTFAMLATRAVGGDNEAACNIIASLPEWATVNKFEKAIKNDSETADEVVGDEQEDVATTEEPKVKPTKKVKAEKAEKANESETTNVDLDGMNAGEMFEYIKAAGRAKDLIAKGYSKKKADVKEYIEKYMSEVNETTDDEEVDEYSDKTAMELFKECKKAGIKAAPKKDKSYYISLLKKANEDTEPEADDDDWDEIEPEVEEKPKKKSAPKAEKKPAKKAKPAPKVEEPEDDDDEDWDI